MICTNENCRSGIDDYNKRRKWKALLKVQPSKKKIKHETKGGFEHRKSFRSVIAFLPFFSAYGMQRMLAKKRLIMRHRQLRQFD